MHNLLFLSAGTGSRLRPYTLSVPKCFIKYKNNYLLQNQFALLNRCRFSKISIVYGKYHYLYKKLNINLIKNPKYKNTNMVYSLYCAKNEFKNNLIISYTDINYSSRVINKLFSKDKYISVIIDKNWKNYWPKRSKNYKSDIETLKIDRDGFIKSIGQKVTNEKIDISGQYIGLIKFPRDKILLIKKELELLFKKKKIGDKDFKKAYLTDFLNYLIKNGFKLKPVFINNDWYEIDTVRDYKSAVTSQRDLRLRNFK